MHIHIHPYTQEQFKQLKKSKCVYIPLLAAGSLCWSKGRLFSFFSLSLLYPSPFPTPLHLFGFLVLEVGYLYTAQTGLEFQSLWLYLSSANITEGCYYISLYLSLTFNSQDLLLITLVFVWQVFSHQVDYWQFVKDIRWLSPHSALHVEKVRVKGSCLQVSLVLSRKTVLPGMECIHFLLTGGERLSQ